MGSLTMPVRALLVAMLIVLASVPALATAPQQVELPEATAEDAFEMQAEIYAEMTGTDLAEAKRRMELQGQVTELFNVLYENTGDVLGGVRIENEPDFHFVVSVVAGGEDRIRPYIEASAFSDMTVIEVVERTEKELLEELDQTVELLHSHGIIDFQIEIWNQREVRITVEDLDTFNQQVTNTGIRLPESVDIIEDPDGLERPAASIIGGYAITGCTAGFAGRLQNTSTFIRGVLTAGHCGQLTTELHP